jgi:hypothetical protein
MRMKEVEQAEAFAGWMHCVNDSGRQQQHSDVETVGLGFEGPLPPLQDMLDSHRFRVNSDDGKGADVVVRSAFRGVQRLVSNCSAIDPEIIKDYTALFPKYQQLFQGPHKTRPRKSAKHESEVSVGDSIVAPVADEEAPGNPPPEPWWRRFLAEHVSLDVFLALCCAFQANGFGVWKANGQGEAAGFFPCCSFFNHSCAPNIGREMNGRIATFFAAKPIRVGEAIELSYVDFKMCKEERQAKLLATYSFLCRCPRCDDPDALTNGDKYNLPLCGDCKAKILRPLDGDNGVVGRCPCCRQTFPLE